MMGSMKKLLVLAISVGLLLPSSGAHALSSGKSLVLQFKGNSFEVTTAHKASIDKYFQQTSSGGAIFAFFCEGQQHKSDPVGKNILAVKRSNSVCEYIESFAPDYLTFSWGKWTSVRSNAGKVVLRADYFSEADYNNGVGSTTSPAAPIKGNTPLGRAFFACLKGVLPKVEHLAQISNDERSLTLTSVGKSVGLSYPYLRCIGNQIGMPEAVHSKIGITNALAGVVEATWPGYSAFWTYHPDHGLNITISKT
jgi:hypothetical protein